MPYGTPAQSAARLMPHTVTMYRPSTSAELDPQTVRIDLTASGEVRGAGAVGRFSATLYGAADLDIARGDTFVWPTGSDTQYRVIQVEPPTPGLIQGGNVFTVAYLEALHA